MIYVVWNKSTVPVRVDSRQKLAPMLHRSGHKYFLYSSHCLSVEESLASKLASQRWAGVGALTPSSANVLSSEGRIPWSLVQPLCAGVKDGPTAKDPVLGEPEHRGALGSHADSADPAGEVDIQESSATEIREVEVEVEPELDTVDGLDESDVDAEDLIEEASAVVEDAGGVKFTREDLEELQMADLRTIGSKFDPVVNARSKAEIIDALLIAQG